MLGLQSLSREVLVVSLRDSGEMFGKTNKQTNNLPLLDTRGMHTEWLKFTVSGCDFSQNSWHHQ